MDAPANVAGNHYDKYASTNPIERRMMSGFLAAFDGMVDGLEPAVLVEVGAGEGEITARLRERFPTASVLGLDLADDELRRAWGGLDVPMLFGDARALPFDDDSVDLVVALEVLEHVPEPGAALAELHRICRGRLVASVPREPIWRAGNLARGRYVRDLGNTPGHVNHWSARAFVDFVGAELTVDSVARPLPWTMVSAHPG
ncbi:MAG: class I SAM-dependent methyltransferase [Actinomycetota bacterium]